MRVLLVSCGGEGGGTAVSLPVLFVLFGMAGRTVRGRGACHYNPSAWREEEDEEEGEEEEVVVVDGLEGVEERLAAVKIDEEEKEGREKEKVSQREKLGVSDKAVEVVVVGKDVSEEDVVGMFLPTEVKVEAVVKGKFLLMFRTCADCEHCNSLFSLFSQA